MDENMFVLNRYLGGYPLVNTTNRRQMALICAHMVLHSATTERWCHKLWPKALRRLYFGDIDSYRWDASLAHESVHRIGPISQ